MNALPGRSLSTTRLLALLLALVGGSHAAAAEPTDPGGGIGGTGKTAEGIGGTGITGFGVVQKFGSIFVNGREFFLDGNTRITRDGVSSGDNSLRLGDVVTVEGRIDAASGRSVAVRVDSETALQGTVEHVDAAAGTLTVLGQTVHLTSSTLSDSPNASPLVQIHRGESIAVSGYARSDGSWSATRIAPAAVGDSRFVLRGEVQTIDREHGRLRVGGQELLAPAAGPPTRLAVGDIVHVDGRYDKADLQAESVVAARPVLGPPGRVVEMSGYIQARPGSGRLVSNDVVLTYSDASTFIGGSAADLGADVPIAIRGETRADGSVAVGAILIGVEPMRVMLPELDAQAPREGGGEGGTSRGAAEKSEREKPQAEQPGAEKRETERPDHPQTERPEIERPEVERPDIERPMIERPEIEMPSTD